MKSRRRANFCGPTRTGTIKRLVIVSVDARSSRFALVLKLDDGRQIRIHLVPPVIECQFLFQIGRRVMLPISRVEGRSHLRLDRAGLKMLRNSGVYDPGPPCAERTQSSVK